MAARGNPRVPAVVAINAYDYDHWPSREAERERYGDIRVPVLLLYGEYDWSRPDERAESARRIPGAASHTVESAGHFLSLDAPDDVIRRVVEFVDRVPARLAR